ncbi:hypothetical protein M6D93_16520 [Jatrophihabitans telluris]|uniref:DUF7224 domain-containing protein n=1 Tax=Jatrophihabitans telluris TaxID=2038343 RepID=A0ABY4QXF9_9ACTN|nr:hypothetical protein [Jatrophihabitans telluris]UQX87892.1 hypothetical protein M6D93_16520 [Jatrophihabitans telluris]
MTPTVRLIARQPATWLAVPLLVICFLQSASVRDPSTTYRLAEWAQATEPIFILAPVCAALCAFEVGRLRTGGVLALPAVRPPLRVVICACWWTVSLSAAVLLVLGWLQAGAQLPPLTIAWMCLLVLVAHSAIAAALATRVSRAVAVPSALVGGYLWLALPPSIEPFWIRHLTGSWGLGCCSVDVAVSSVAVAGLTVVNTVLCGLGMAACHRIALRTLIVPATVLLLVAGSAGYALVRRLGPDPVEPRRGAVNCAPASISICVWPENLTTLPALTAVVGQAAPIWSRLGVVLPASLSERRGPHTSVSPFGVSPRMSRSELLASVAQALVPPGPNCGSRPFESAVLQSYLYLWLVETAGVPGDVISPLPQEQAVVAAIMSRTATVQTHWYRRLVRALDECSTPPSEVLAP